MKFERGTSDGGYCNMIQPALLDMNTETTLVLSDLEDIETHLQKESENIFTLWCSGRTCCEGMLVELKLLKRQDLVAVIANAIKTGGQKDQVSTCYIGCRLKL